MNSFILKENICYSISKTELKTISGYVVCRDGKCAGVFEEFPEKYKDLELRDLKDSLVRWHQKNRYLFSGESLRSLCRKTIRNHNRWRRQCFNRGGCILPCYWKS